MIKKLKQADFLREDYTTRIQMYYNDSDNSIYVEKVILSEIDTYTDRIDSVPSDQDQDADMLFIYYCENEMRRWIEISSAEKGIPDESIQGTYESTKK